MSHHGNRIAGSARQNKEHAISRAAERYGIELSNSKRKKIAQRIEAGCYRVVKNGALAQRKIYSVYFEEKHLWVVYDHYTHRIVTFLHNNQNRERQ